MTLKVDFSVPHHAIVVFFHIFQSWIIRSLQAHVTLVDHITVPTPGKLSPEGDIRSTLSNGDPYSDMWICSLRLHLNIQYVYIYIYIYLVDCICSFGCFQKKWYPQIIHFNRVFHYKPSILGYHYFWKHPFLNVSHLGSTHTQTS